MLGQKPKNKLIKCSFYKFFIMVFKVDTFVFTFYYVKLNKMEVFNIANFNNKNKDDLPINDQIRVGEVMLIGPNGEQMGTKPLEFAKQIANAAGLDLVLMNPGSDRPVTKIMDYNRFKYEKNKKQKEALKKQNAAIKELKEYRLSAKIDIGDFNTKAKNARDYLEKGHKIKVSIRFRGREMAHTEIGEEVLNRFAENLSEVSTVEAKPKLDGRNMTMLLAPKNN